MVRVTIIQSTNRAEEGESRSKAGSTFVSLNRKAQKGQDYFRVRHWNQCNTETHSSTSQRVGPGVLHIKLKPT